MEVAEHDVRLLTTQQTNCVVVDVAAEQGHGPTGAEATSADISTVEVVDGTVNDDRGSKSGGDILGLNYTLLGCVLVGGQNSVWGGIVVPKVGNHVGHSQNGPQERMATTSVVDDFASDAIFRGGKFERNAGGGIGIRNGGGI